MSTTLNHRPSVDTSETTPFLPDTSKLATGDSYSQWKRSLAYLNVATKGNLPLLTIAASQLFYTVMITSAKFLMSIDPPISNLQIIWVRMVVTYACCIIYMLFAKIPHPWLGPPEVRPLLIARGIWGFAGVVCVYYSLQYVSVSDSTTLTFLIPFCTAFAGAVFLGEKFTLKEAAAGSSSLIGVILIARPKFIFGAAADDTSGSGTSPEQRLLAVGVMLIDVICSAGAFVTIRAIGKRASVLHATASFSLHGVIGSSIGLFILKIPIVTPPKVVWIVLLLEIGALGFIAQMLMTYGLQRERPGRGTLALYTQIVWAVIFQRIFFHSSPPPLSILGTIIIVSSAVYVVLTKAPNIPERTSSVEDGHSNTETATLRSPARQRI